MTALDYPGTEALLVAVESERAYAFYRREGFVEAPKYFAKLLNQ
ncbi:hypothetical protein ACJ8MJ_01490 [Serratia sp. CY56907]|nr:hypothetical protein [Serratia marcescens]